MLYVLQEAGVENHFYEGLVRRRPGLQPWLVADFCFIQWLMRTLSGTDTIANVPSVNIHGVVDDSPPFRLLMIQVLYINCFMTIITKEKQFKSSIIHKLLLKTIKFRSCSSTTIKANVSFLLSVETSLEFQCHIF